MLLLNFGTAVVPHHGHPHAAAIFLVHMCARCPRAIPHSPGLLDHGVRPEQNFEPDRPPCSCSILAPRWCLTMATPTLPQNLQLHVCARRPRAIPHSPGLLDHGVRPEQNFEPDRPPCSCSFFLNFSHAHAWLGVQRAACSHSVCCHRLTSTRRVWSPSACP